jgi:uncharacterized membrane protein
MPDTLDGYMEWIMLETLFSGYLLVFSILYIVSAYKGQRGFIKIRIMPLLPLTYAFVGTIFWGLQLRVGHSYNTFQHFVSSLQYPFLHGWALLSILFWIPFLRERPILSALHSSIFFALMMIDLFAEARDKLFDNSLLGNGLKIYSVSLGIYITALLFLLLGSKLIHRIKRENA